VKFDHSVLKAFSPYFAGAYLMRNKEEGWRSLGGLLLAFTGVEALFADLGAFSKRAVQISWLFFAFPCLLLAYIGQAAYISQVSDSLRVPMFIARLLTDGFLRMRLRRPIPIRSSTLFLQEHSTSVWSLLFLLLSSLLKL
jgi:K+ transporter